MPQSADPPCPVCGSTGTLSLVHRQGVPVQQNFPLNSAAQALAAPRGELDMRWCASCGFGFNAAFQSGLLDYGTSYENTQSYSPCFREHRDALRVHLLAESGVRNCQIVEVGCGQGDFLLELVRDPTYGNRGIGFDPAYTGPAADLDGRYQVQSRLFGNDADIRGEVFVSRHLIEHLPDPLDFLRAIAAAMSTGPGRRRLFLETPDLAWILRNQVFWDLFYEHCSLFTERSLTAALHQAGFGRVRIRRVFGDQYLWAEAELGADPTGTGAPLEPLTALAARFATHEQERIAAWLAIQARGCYSGPVAVWGAGAKGVTFCHLIDPGCERLAGVIDINPAKQGKFVPVTAHPIHGPTAWLQRGGSGVLVLNPNYLEEIRRTLLKLGAAIQVVDMMEFPAAE